MRAGYIKESIIETLYLIVYGTMAFGIAVGIVIGVYALFFWIGG